VGLLALCACASHPSNFLMTAKSTPESFGYTERRVTDTGYEISYSGPEVTTANTRDELVYVAESRARETANDLALWRAAELALGKGYPAFVVTSARCDVKQIIVGHDYHQNGNPVYDDVPGQSIGYPMQIYFRPEAVIGIELRKDRPEGALDARELSEKIKRRYADAGSKAIAPNTYYFFGPSVFVHDTSRPAPGPGSGPHLKHPPYIGNTY
jgi:hypothetical protein